MGNNGETKPEKRTMLALMLLVALLIPVSIILFMLGEHLDEKREAEQEQLRTDTLRKIVNYGNTESDTAQIEFDRNLAKEVELKVSFLREAVTKSGYKGPRMFEDGFIAELDGDNVILPEEMQAGQVQISRELIEESIASGSMRTGQISFPDSILDTEIPVDEERIEEERIEEERKEQELMAQEAQERDPENTLYFLSFGRITDTLIYVEMTPEVQYIDYRSLYMPDSLTALQTATKMFGGATLLIRDDDGSLVELGRFGDIEGSEGLSDLGITSEMIRKEETFSLQLNGREYRCDSVKANGAWLDSENAYVVQVIPKHSSDGENITQGATISLLMLLILLTMTVLILSERRFVQEHVLTGEELNQYGPVKLRRKTVNAGLAGAVVILAVSFLTQAIGQMYQQTRYGRDTLQLLSEMYAQSSKEEQGKLISEGNEEWYVKYCEEIAAFLDKNPEKATPQKLIEFCEILKTDYIMLFDSEGREVLCSRDYEGFTLDKGLGENSSDFRRLLMGIPSIVHSVSIDEITGLERQMIGVKMAALDDSSKHGALIMALMPDQTAAAIDVGNWEEESSLMQTEGVLCFIADGSTGNVLYSGDTSMTGRNVLDCGLTEKSLSDGFMDYGTVNGVRRFIVTRKSGKDILYYTTVYDDLLKENLIFSLVSTLLYLLAMVAIAAFLLKGYSLDRFKEWSNRKLPHSEKASGIIDQLFGWKERTPEKKASLVFYVGLFFTLQIWVRLILGQSMGNDQYSSMFDYLLAGDWMRGFNLFALCSILMVIAVANLVTTLSSWFLMVLAGVLTPKGKTVCLLMKSMIQYAAIVIVIVISLGYLGVLNSTVIASLGIGSLALSLGAKDLVTDILAGICIVFEETMGVGDVIEYNGIICTVQEIGMRSTKLDYPPGNCLSVSNREIGVVKNLSKHYSMCTLGLMVKGTESLQRLEEILERELPDIGKKSNLVRGRLRYLGLTSVGHGLEEGKMVSSMTLTIGVECEQKDLYAVRLFLNREIRLLAEREGIELF